MPDDNPHNRKYAMSQSPALEGRAPSDQDTVDSKELCELTGATYRQIDYWCRQGIIHAAEDNLPGSGYRRRFAKSLIDKVKLVVRISNAFNRHNSPLKDIAECYELGEYNMGEGVYLTWDVVEIERDVK